MILHSGIPLLRKNFISNILMASKSKFFTQLPLQSSSLSRQFTSPKISLSPLSIKPISTTSPLSHRFYCSSSFASTTVCVEKPEIERVDPENLIKKLKEVNINLPSYELGKQYQNLLCPMCKGGNSQEKSFSVKIADDGSFAAWHCFRGKCGCKGVTNVFAGTKSSYQRMTTVDIKKKIIRKITDEDLQLELLCSKLITYFTDRLISAETLRRNHVMQKVIDNDKVVIAFPYRRNGSPVTCKYMDLDGMSWLEEDTEKIFFGLDDIKEESDIIIVENEMDKLSMEEAGFRNCVSVPSILSSPGPANKLPSIAEDTEYQYLWNCQEYLEKASRVILATNANPHGQALAEEIARRVGRERCWRVRWPKKSEDVNFKDVNEVLMCNGPSALKEVIEKAELYPIQGLRHFQSYASEIEGYYHQTFGYELGVSTGWEALDNLYKVVPGELTIVTGVPNSGKSEWIDSLLCNLNKEVGWKFALCSMENSVREHARKLLEKHIKRPFFKAGYGSTVERMSFDELQIGKQWLSKTFFPIRCEKDSLPDIDWVLGLAKSAVLRYGINGLVIDPYNELDHQRHSNQTETEYVSRLLTKVKRFAQHHSCHVWFVAHPRQLYEWDGGPPTMYDISGSAHFINKCDNGVVVHRNRDPKKGPIDLVQICVRKVRNKVAGNIGDAFLTYDRVTGRFKDIDAVDPEAGLAPEAEGAEPEAARAGSEVPGAEPEAVAGPGRGRTKGRGGPREAGAEPEAGAQRQNQKVRVGKAKLYVKNINLKNN